MDKPVVTNNISLKVVNTYVNNNSLKEYPKVVWTYHYRYLILYRQYFSLYCLWLDLDNENIVTFGTKFKLILVVFEVDNLKKICFSIFKCNWKWLVNIRSH